MNLKKILLGTFAVVVSAVSLAPATNAALNDAEFTSALSWAYENGLTKFNTEDAFNPYSNITREQASKFFASYTVTNLCDVEAMDDAACDFSDINSGDYSLKEYVLLACELGLVKGTGGKFLPTNNLTRAEAFTILSRAMSANAGEDAPSEDVAPWYANHFKAMQSAGITKETDVTAQERPITRYELLLVLYRSKMDDATCSDTDITDLLEDLFGDDTTTTGDDTTEEVITESNGMAKAMLSPMTLNGATVPGKVSVKVASFDFTASTEAVVVTEIVLKRMGLGSDDVVDKVTLFANNEVVTKSKSFTSDDEIVFALNPAVTVEPGKTVTIDVVAKLGDSATVSNQEFSVALTSFDTNGKEESTNLPINANTFRVGGINGAEVVLNDDGSISDVNLGDKGVEVAKFEMENNGDSDVTITQITLEDDEKNADDNLENFVLKHKGVTVGTVAKANGKYVTFVLSTPVVIGENETEDFRVYADVIAGAGDDISFVIDQEIYVLGKDAKYGYGIAVDVTAYAPQTFSILAGELTLVEKKLPNDLARADRDEFVLAHFELIPNAGKDLSLEAITFVLNGSNTLGGDTWGEVFENVELQVTINGAVKRFDLNETNDTTTTLTMSDDDLGIFLKSTDNVVVKLVADTVSTFPANWTNGDDSFSVYMSTAFPGFEVIENEDDERVTKIVPSSMTFDVVDLVTSTVNVTKLNIGTSVNAVKGSEDIDAYKFQVKPDAAGDVYIQSFDFDVDVAGCPVTPDADLLSAVKLWKWEGTGSGAKWVLLEQQGGFDITPAGGISFDDFMEVEVLASKTQQFLLTVNINDDDAVAGCSFDVNIVASDIEDDDNKDLTVVVPVAIGRTINVTAAGSLNVKLDNSDTKANRTKHVLAGTTSDYVASYELSATNEAILIKDLDVVAAGAGLADFIAAGAMIELYVNNETTPFATEEVTSATTTFEDVDLVIPTSPVTNIYAKIVAQKVGDAENGLSADDVTLALEVVDAEGNSSNATVTPLHDGFANVPTLPSFAFDIIPVHISNVAISDAGAIGNTQLSNGANIIGTIEITANSWDNTDLNDNSDIEALLSVLDFVVDDSAGIVTAITVERMDITTADKVCDATGGSVNFGTCDAVVAQIDEGVTARFRVEVTVAGAMPSDSVQLRFNNLNGGEIQYESTDTDPADPLIDELRLSIGNSILGVKKSVSN